MDPKMAKQIADMHRRLEDAYMQAATAACESRSPHEVWEQVQAAHAEAAKARRIEMRYGRA